MIKNGLSRLMLLAILATELFAIGPGSASAEFDQPGAVAFESDRESPNIILIMLDDMGYSDLGCYGGEIDTPQMDKLAQNGVRFNQFYNCGRCCPTRASIITGLYAHRAGVGHMANRDYGFKGYKGELRPEAITVAENLKQTGYQTWMVGKWHLSINFDPRGPKHGWPLQRGFDKFYGTLIAAGSQWNPITLTEGNENISPVKPDEDYYYTEAITNKALSWIQTPREERPFFLYVAYTAPHWPLHARQEVIDKYKERYQAGWDELRKRRLERMVKEGLIPADCILSERDPDVLPWKETKNHRWQANRMAAYAAMIDQVDTAIGKIVNGLEAQGVMENTMIVVCSDNGGSALDHPNGLIGSTGAPWTTMRYVPIRTRDGRTIISGDVVGLDPGPENTYGGYGGAWANLSNAPFRMFKKFSHEGGIASPLIVHWPAGIEHRGTVVHDPAHVIDLMPTFLDAADAEHPQSFKEEKTLSLDGVSLLPLIQDGKSLDRDILGFEHAGNRAIRVGEWKLVAKNSKPWALFHLANDRTEMRDLANSQPEKLAEMIRHYEKWATDNWVEDWQVVSDTLGGTQSGTVVLPDHDNPLRRTQNEIDASVDLINMERKKRGLPTMRNLAK